MFANPSFDQFLFFLFFAVIFFAALSDVTSFRIPNAASIALIVVFPLHVLASNVPVDWIGGVAVAFIVFLAGLGLFAAGLVGGGDVKLLSATALWAGSGLVLRELLVMGLAGGILAALVWLLQIARRYRSGGLAQILLFEPGAAQAKVPYGVAIAAGAGYTGLKLLNG